MKYKFRFIILLSIVFLLILVGCDDEFSIEVVDVVTFYNYDGTLLWETEVFDDNTITYQGPEPIRQSNEYSDYIFTGWNHDLYEMKNYRTFIAQYSEIERKYSVILYNYTGKEIVNDEVAYGTNYSINLSKPSKPSTDDYEYIFTGWTEDLSCITSDVAARPIFKEVKLFTVTFVDETGETLKTKKVQYGSTVSTSDVTTPIKESTEQYQYDFEKWDFESQTIYEDTIARPIYKTRKLYTVKFMDNNNNLLYSCKIPEGGTATYQGATPYKTSTSYGNTTYTYSFSGWSQSLVNITCDLYVTPIFTQTVVLTGEAKVKNYLLTNGTGATCDVVTGENTKIGYYNSYYHVIFNSVGDGITSTFTMSCSYQSGPYAATFQIYQSGIKMFEAQYSVTISNHQYSSITVYNVITNKYTTAEQATMVAMMTILAAKNAINNGTSFLSSHGLDYIY